MEVLGRLAGAVIHDLNNLLTVIQLNAGLIEMGGLEEDEVIAAAGKIDQASCRAAELTRKVLNFARGQADETVAVNLQELVNGLSRLLEPLIAKRVRIEIVPGAESLWVHGNRGGIEQAIMNLVLNGVDAMPSGGGVTISFLDRKIGAGEASGCEAGEYACVVVTDEGVGIPPEARERVFEPFFTTKISGTGMGLSIVSRIARRLGGMVEFDSEPGSGAEFRLWLPKCAPPSDQAIREPVSIDIQMTNRTVLYVEDDEGVRNLTRQLLEADGLRVLPAESGEEAFELWKKHREEVSLLFTDIMLPGALSGRDLALEILEREPSLPVLYTSGYSGVEADQSYCNASNFLPKPFQPDALRSAVRTALAGS